MDEEKFEEMRRAMMDARDEFRRAMEHARDAMRIAFEAASVEMHSARDTLREEIDEARWRLHDELEEANPPLFRISAEVGSEWFCALAGRASPPVISLPESNGQAFLALAAGYLASKGLAGDDHRKRAAFRPDPLKRLHFGVRPAGFCRVWRA